MLLYRIVQNKSRSRDLSGSGAYQYGGRWNSKGTYMLYTSENSSLAYLEFLAHVDPAFVPPHLYIIELNLDDAAPVLIPAENDYPRNWQKPGLKANQELGDKWMKELKYLAVKVRSAVNTLESNYLLNPLFPSFNAMVKIQSVKKLDFDARLK
jgi:RES domain-containing protein